MTNVLIFDTETTSASNHKDWTRQSAYPVQFYGGVYKQPDDLGEWFEIGEDSRLELKEFKPVTELNTLIQLPDHEIMEEGALAVHGIDREKANSLGICPTNAAHVICDLLDMSDIAVAHNVTFDKNVINSFVFDYAKELFPENGSKDGVFESVETYCTMKKFTPILKLPGGRYGEYKWPKLEEAYRFFFGKELVGAHDAKMDCIATIQIYFAHRYFQQLGIAPKGY